VTVIVEWLVMSRTGGWVTTLPAPSARLATYVQYTAAGEELAAMQELHAMPGSLKMHVVDE
jgi:hypothetical protein